MEATIEITPELMAGFLDEAADHLGALNRYLLAFEKQAEAGPIDFSHDDDLRAMNEMFRAAHSLKGLSGAFGFADINRLTHVMETLCDEARMRRRVLDADALGLLLRGVGMLEAAVADLQEPSETPPNVTEVIQALEALMKSPGPAAAAATAPSTESPAPPHPSPEASLPRTLLDDPELRSAFIESAEESVEELTQSLLALEKGATVELLNATYRIAHTLKGACGAAGLHDATQLTHRMESAFEELRSGQRTVSEGLIGGCLKIADCLREAVERIKADKYSPITPATLDELTRKLSEAPSAAPAAAAPPPAPRGVEGFAAPADAIVQAGRGYQVLIEFKPDNSENDLQAFLLLNKLRSLGDVTWFRPDFEKGDPIATSAEFVLRAGDASESGCGGLRALLQAFPIALAQVRSFEPVESIAPPQPVAPPAGGPAASGAAAPGGGARRPAVQGTTETIRVDVERLDQLMNLGGELVINRARFSQVGRRFKTVFEGKDPTFIAEEAGTQLQQLTDLLRQVGAPPEAQARVASLGHSIDSLHQVIRRVHDARGAMHDFDEAVNTLDRVSEGLQKRIMETRMVPIGPLFQRFQRLTRDLAKELGKKIELAMSGENTELDKKMIDELADPLTHIIRNSADHGIESPADRVNRGKPAAATITLSAYHQGNNICIDVHDDGRGIDLQRVREKALERELATETQLAQMSDHEIVQFIFHPGFSTAKQVSDLSGRGMGMDIVKTKLANLNGAVEVDTVPGSGTTIKMKLPLTLAIIKALLTRIGREVYAIPLETVSEIVSLRRAEIRSIQAQRVAHVRNSIIPVFLIEETLDVSSDGLRTASIAAEEWTIVILEGPSGRAGLVVDHMLGQEDIVIKSLAENYRNVHGFSGATIMGDGRVSLILDVSNVLCKRGGGAA